MFAFRREEGDKVFGFLKSLLVCKKFPAHSKQSRKANTQLFQTKQDFPHWNQKAVFFDLEKNAMFGSFNCRLCQEQDESNSIHDLK